MKVTAYAVKPTKMVCGLGKWDCKPTFIVRKSKGVSLVIIGMKILSLAQTFS